MKLNKEIVSKNCPVYDSELARELFEKGVGYRKLSLMKQENIRVALKDNDIGLRAIQDGLNQYCGYCIKFGDDCDDCILTKKVGNICISLFSWDKMMASNNKSQFSRLHKSWCKKLGLWAESWK